MKTQLIPTAALTIVLMATSANTLAQSAGHAGHHDEATSATMNAPMPSAVLPRRTRPAAVRPAMAEMDHGNMLMQGGGAPEDARDPHAYSGGNTLYTGPYALGPTRSLRLGDEDSYGMFLADRLEAARSDGRTTGGYDLMARFGRDYDRLVLKAEGEVVSGSLEESRTEALWSHAVATFWDTQLGLRQDTGPGPSRTWLAFGVQGLAPYWFEVDATAYVGEAGRTALRLSAEYELLLTQRLVLQPRIEASAYGQSDPENGIGNGLSNVSAGLRLRYEFTRQFAPYIGVEWTGAYGETADLRRAASAKLHETRIVAGVRLWF